MIDHHSISSDSPGKVGLSECIEIIAVAKMEDIVVDKAADLAGSAEEIEEVEYVNSNYQTPSKLKSITEEEESTQADLENS